MASKIIKCGKCGKTFKTRKGYTNHSHYTGGRTRTQMLREISKNPSLPKGKFISCKAVKFNKNGSVSIKK